MLTMAERVGFEPTVRLPRQQLFEKAASIRPLSHLSPELDFSAELTPSLLELGVSQVGNG